MPIDFRATTSLPSLGAAPLPTSAIGEYINKQIIPTEQRTSVEASRNMYKQPITRDSTQVSLAQPSTEPRDIGTSDVSALSTNISDSNKRMMGYAQEAAAKRAAQNQANQQNTGGGGNVDYSNIPVGNLTGNRAKAMQLSSSYLGNPYVLGGTSHQGIDCSGLVKVVYNQLGFNLPVHSSTWQRDNIPGVRTNNINSLQPGDIVAWKHGGHIAVYAGNGYIIQAANPSQGVIKSLLTQQVGYTPDSVIGIKLRFPGE